MGCREGTGQTIKQEINFFLYFIIPVVWLMMFMNKYFLERFIIDMRITVQGIIKTYFYCGICYGREFIYSIQFPICTFLFSGHTKNLPGGAFGLKKRELKRRNVLVPEDMISVIDEISDGKHATLLLFSGMIGNKILVFISQFQAHLKYQNIMCFNFMNISLHHYHIKNPTLFERTLILVP